MRRLWMLVVLLGWGFGALCAQQRYVVVDQDGGGPGGSDQQSILLLLQAQGVKVLGVTMVSGDVSAEEGVRHTMRMLEMVGRTDVPVVMGSGVPLIRTPEETALQERLYGSVSYTGAYGKKRLEAGALVEGEPKTKVIAGEDAAHFLIAAVRRYPHQVTVFSGGPMTNIALAIRLDPGFAAMARELVFMGGSLNPKTDDPEFAFNPRHEFNFWFDPEAAHIVLTAPWKKITGTTIDASIQAVLPAQVQAEVKGATTPVAVYMNKYEATSPYLWDELAALAWIEPRMVRAEKRVYMDVDINHGHSYGDTLTWSEAVKPALPLQMVDVNMEVDAAQFQAEYLKLMTTPAVVGERGK